MCLGAVSQNEGICDDSQCLLLDCATGNLIQFGAPAVFWQCLSFTLEN